LSTIFTPKSVYATHSLDLAFADTHEYVLEELRSQPLTDWVYGRTHSNRDDLPSDIRDWERMRAKRKEKLETANSTSTKLRHVKQKSVTEPLGTKSTNVAPAVPPKTTIGAVARSATYKAEDKTDVSRERPTFYCFNCRAAGHISEDFPKPRRPIKCSNCHSDQHTRARCPTANTDRTDTSLTADQA